MKRNNNRTPLLNCVWLNKTMVVVLGKYTDYWTGEEMVQYREVRSGLVVNMPSHMFAQAL